MRDRTSSSPSFSFTYQDGRWSPAVTVVPYVILAVLAIFTAVYKHPATVDLVLCGVTALWMLWMFTLHPGWRTRPRIMAVFLAGVIVLWAILVIRNAWFGFFAPAGYFYVFALSVWPWQLAGVIAVAMIAGTAQASGLPQLTFLGLLTYCAVLLANVLPMSLGAWIMWRRATQENERKRALAELSEANRRLEASLAENAGLHEQLLARAREAGVLDERARMAREIHDTLAQGLTGIITQLQAAEQATESSTDWRRHVTAATKLARESLTEARRSVHALRPQPLDTGRLSEALAQVAERWSALHDIPVQVTTTGTVRPIRPEAEFVLLRTAQEALANVVKHARASRVGVTLSYLDDQVALDVRDDGKGFRPAELDGHQEAADTVPAGGFGLVAMRERIEGLAGTLQIESEPGAGTAISACVPAAPVGAHA